MVRIEIGLAASLVIVAGCSTAEPAPSGDLHSLEAYEGGSKQVEDQYVAFLAGFFGRDPAPGEPLLRGTHAVGTCTAATFEIDDIRARANVPDEYAVGVFAQPASYDARVRFSNGLGAPADPSRGFDDKDYDARAMAVQLDYRDGQPQDFVLQNSPIFPIWPVEGFALVVQLSIARSQGQEKEFMTELSPGQRATLAKVIALVGQYQRDPGVVVRTFTPMPDAYRLETYWSGKAHQLGVNGVPVKYIAKPCASNGEHVPTKAVDFGARSADFLQEELKRHIEQPGAGESPACFHFYLQPLQADAMTDPEGQVLPAAEHWRWVEDTTLEWKEAEAPAYRVGRITLRGPVLPPAVCDDPENFINSSINTLPEHKGLGRISRAEAVAAPASIARRTPK
jgi:catalase